MFPSTAWDHAGISSYKRLLFSGSRPSATSASSTSPSSMWSKSTTFRSDSFKICSPISKGDGYDMATVVDVAAVRLVHRTRRSSSRVVIGPVEPPIMRADNRSRVKGGGIIASASLICANKYARLYCEGNKPIKQSMTLRAHVNAPQSQPRSRR